MTAAEHQQMVDIARLQVHEYFDHYLTEVFPTQICSIIDAHDKDGMAHEVRIGPLDTMKRSFYRYKWMILGGVAVLGFVGGVLAPHIPAIIKALLP
jgi:hypothetical protein